MHQFRSDYIRPVSAESTGTPTIGKIVDSEERTRLDGSKIFNENEWRALGSALHVSEREFQILRFVFDDQTKAQIAEVLEISAHTVHTYLGRLYRKLGVSSREQLIVRVVGEYLRLFHNR